MRFPILFFCFLVFQMSLGFSQEFDGKILDNARQSVVSIQGRANHAAYSNTGKWAGTGFVVSKKKGLILTNRHVIGPDTTSSFDISFYNGKEVEAKILYVDPIQDFGFLKVDPKLIPDDAVELKFSETGPVMNAPIIIMGKNEDQSFSFNFGRVSSLYESVGLFHNQSFRISLNAQGGASGSPVLDGRGEIVGLTHSSNLSSSAFAYPICYCADALKFILDDKKPQRQSTGVVLEYHSLDKIQRYTNLDPDLLKKYQTDYPDSSNKALVVSRVLGESPAVGILQPGDVIREVNEKEIGPQAYLFDKMIDEGKKAASITIYRQGKKKTVQVSTYDLDKNLIRQMLTFGGATFYEVDHQTKFVTGVPYGAVFVSNIRPGTTFDNKFPPIAGTNKLFIHLTAIDNTPVKTLEDLERIIPELVKKKDFTVTYMNYAFYIGHSGMPVFARFEAYQEISYDPLDGDLSLFTFDEKNHKWTVKNVLQ